MKLFLDDIRDPYPDYILVKNYAEFVSFLNTGRIPDIISFDHDLGDAFSGLDCAKFLCSVVDPLNFPTCIIHSHNPVGVENLYSYLTSYCKVHNLTNKIFVKRYV